MTRFFGRLSGALGLALALASCSSWAVPVPPSAEIVLVGVTGTTGGGEWVEDGQYLMGTVLEISLLAGAGNAASGRRALREAFETVRGLDALLSRFDPNSDVSRLNARAGDGRVRVDPRALQLLQFARAGTHLTRGAFDVTVGPLVSLWIAAAAGDELPTDAEIAERLELVSADRIRIAPPCRVDLAKGGMSLDLGGVAKGFALDLLRRDLQASGFDRGLLSFGQSSVWALGTPPDAPGWRLLVRSPEPGRFAGVVEVSDRALSVSSTLGQSSEIGGVRYGHVVDPRTGRAVTERRQVVVVAASAALAEVLSTALAILPVAEGLAVVEAQDAEALVIDHAGRFLETSGWQQATHFERRVGG